MASTWLPVRREAPQQYVTTVRCPRKGPLPNEISLLICGQMHDARPERCESCGCRQALVFGKQLEELRGATRASMRVFREPAAVSDADGVVVADDVVEGGEVV